MLTTVVNLSHTLSPSVHEVFEVANLELVERLDNNYDPMSSDLLIQPEDLIKIANTMLNHGQMKDNLKQQMIEHIEEENLQFTYEILSELAVVYALKMDETYKNMFFSKLRMRFIKEIEFLNDETLYKILWAFFKGKAITIQTSNPEWQAIKEILVKKSKDINPKILTDILVIATVEE